MHDPNKDPDFDSMTDAEAVARIGLAVDEAGDREDDELNTSALAWCDRIASRPLINEDSLRLDYFRSNALSFAGRRRRAATDSAWEWDQEEVQQQIFFLRRAMRNPVYDEVDVELQCQIQTNLATAFSFCGRLVEAIALWADVLVKAPAFYIARGNRASSFIDYGQFHIDVAPGPFFIWHAHRELERVLAELDAEPPFLDANARTHFQSKFNHIIRLFDLHKIGEYVREASSAVEIHHDAYRRWSVEQGLFLNTLNDIAPMDLAAGDDLNLPSLITKVGESPVVVAGFFNQLKQEFVSARWMFYEAITHEGVHDSDRDVDLSDTLDGAAYGLSIEKMKVAFRMNYSILDKIAYFLNHYLDLDIPEREISFRGVWRQKKSIEVRDEFRKSKNSPLRGLYWLSKDLFEPDFDQVADPDAKRISELRNHLEHKYVKVHAYERSSVGENEHDIWYDDLAYSITVDQLERRTLRLMRLTRAALIYLILGMFVEESRRSRELPEDVYVPQFEIIPLDEDRKRRW